MHRVAPAPAAQAVTRRKRVRWTWLPVAVLLAALAGTVGFLRVWPPLATVMSASMSPTIDTGDMVVLKRLSEPAHIGDIVVINVPTEARSRYGYPPVVIHRIVRIAADGAVTTKGDAHKEPDPFVVPRAAIATKVVATLPAAGRVIAFLSSGLGLLWLAAGVALFVGMPLFERHRDSQRREQAEADDLHTSLRTLTTDLTLLRSDRLDERDELERLLDDKTQAAAAAQAQLEAVTAAFTEHLQSLPAQIERAVAAAVGTIVSAPPPPAVAPPRVASRVRSRLAVEASGTRRSRLPRPAAGADAGPAGRAQRPGAARGRPAARPRCCSTVRRPPGMPSLPS